MKVGGQNVNQDSNRSAFGGINAKLLSSYDDYRGNDPIATSSVDPSDGHQRWPIIRKPGAGNNYN